MAEKWRVIRSVAALASQDRQSLIGWSSPKNRMLLTWAYVGYFPNMAESVVTQFMIFGEHGVSQCSRVKCSWHNFAFTSSHFRSHYITHPNLISFTPSPTCSSTCPSTFIPHSPVSGPTSSNRTLPPKLYHLNYSTPPPLHLYNPDKNGTRSRTTPSVTNSLIGSWLFLTCNSQH